MNALQSATAVPAPPPGGPSVDAEVLTAIAGACRDHERLRFAYKARDGAQTRRYAEPLSLVNLGRRWYLVAFDCDRDDWRTFRLDRIEQVPAAGARFTPRTLPGGDPAAFVSQNLSGAQYRHQARITLHASAEEVARRARWAPPSQLEPLDEHSCSYRPSDDSLEWLALRIAFLGVDFEVHEPPELAAECAALARRFGAAAGAAGDGRV